MNKTIIQIFNILALIATLFLLGVVALSIIARIIHDLSSGNISFMFPGAIELSKYTLLFIVFSALPHAVTKGLVRVDLLSDKFPLALQNFLDTLWLIFMAGFTGSLTWLFSQKTWLTFNRGDATQDLLIPLFYFYAFISLACIATFLVCLLNIRQTQKAGTD